MMIKVNILYGICFGYALGALIATALWGHDWNYFIGILGMGIFVSAYATIVGSRNV